VPLLSTHLVFGGYQWQKSMLRHLRERGTGGFTDDRRDGITEHCSRDRLRRLQVTEIMCDDLTPGHRCCGFLLLSPHPLQGGEAASLRALPLTEQLLQLARAPETCPCCSPLHRGAGALEGAGVASAAAEARRHLPWLETTDSE